MNYDTLLVYCVVSFFYITSPGPATLLAMYNGATRGSKCVMVSAVGNSIGLMILSVLSVSGLSAILLTSATLFTLVKIAGASYLIFLGIKQIRSSKNMHSDTLTGDTLEPRSLAYFFKEGLLVAVTNPKPIIFFAALFPQFLDTDLPLLTQFTTMTLIFMVFSFISLSTYGYLAQRAAGFLATSENVKWFHRISGGLFVVMGASLLQVKIGS